MSLQRKQVAKAIYDFDVDGGAVSTITPQQTETIPAGAIVTNIYANETTALTSGGSATVELKAGSVSLTDPLAFDTGFTAKPETLALDNSLTAIPVATAADLSITVATAALTAGVVEFYVEYVV